MIRSRAVFALFPLLASLAALPVADRPLSAQSARYDVVITVCDETNAERCPMFPGRGTRANAERLHWGFSDPSALPGTDEEKLAAIRPIRDAIRARLEAWLTEQGA